MDQRHPTLKTPEGATLGDLTLVWLRLGDISALEPEVLAAEVNEERRRSAMRAILAARRDADRTDDPTAFLDQLTSLTAHETHGAEARMLRSALEALADFLSRRQVDGRLVEKLLSPADGVAELRSRIVSGVKLVRERRPPCRRGRRRPPFMESSDRDGWVADAVCSVRNVRAIRRRLGGGNPRTTVANLLHDVFGLTTRNIETDIPVDLSDPVAAGRRLHAAISGRSHGTLGTLRAADKHRDSDDVTAILRRRAGRHAANTRDRNPQPVPTGLGDEATPGGT